MLVVDDHRSNRELVRVVLGPFGPEVAEAGGAEAVVAAAEPFDLILMDLQMPVMDGLGAMKQIRGGDGPNRATPILAFSAGANAPGADQRRTAGFDGDLAKPLLPADLLAAVAGYAAVREPAAARSARATRREAPNGSPDRSWPAMSVKSVHHPNPRIAEREKIGPHTIKPNCRASTAGWRC